MLKETIWSSLRAEPQYWNFARRFRTSDRCRGGDERYLGEHQDSTFAKQDSNVHRPQQVIPPRRAARDPTPESQDLSKAFEAELQQ